MAVSKMGFDDASVWEFRGGRSSILFTFVFTVVVMLVAALPSVCCAQSTKTVLLLNSYSYDMKWTRSITEAVTSAFEDVPEANLVVEFMDTKRNHSQSYYDGLIDLYTEKYAKTQFDVVITSDDNAVNFALKYRNRLFPGAPIVFSGVNNVALPEREDFKNISGALEVPGLTETLEMIATLHPELLKLYIVNESYTVTSPKDRQALEEQLGRFGKMFESYWLEDLSDDEMKEALSNLPPYSAVLLLSFFPDKKSNTFKVEDGAHFVSSASSRPVYSMWEYFLGKGIVGGQLTSGTYQGNMASKMALEILSGKSPNSIPVVSFAANQFMFDYDQLERFNIAVDNLPEGSVIINMPSSMWQQFRTQISLVFAVIAVLTVLCIVLAKNNRARKRVELELNEVNRELHGVLAEREGELRKIKLAERSLKEAQKAEREANNALRLNMAQLRTLIESIPDLVWFKDLQGIYLFCNQRFERFFGAPESEIVGKTDYDYVDEKTADFFRKNDIAAMKAGKATVNEEVVTYKDDGHTEELETIKTPIYDNQGELVGVLGVARDITKRNRFAKELIERQMRFKALHDAAFGAIAFLEDGSIRDCSQGLADILGYTTKELIGMDVSCLVAESSREKIVETISSGAERSIQAIGITKDGDNVLLRLETLLIPYKGRKVLAIEFRVLSSG